VNVNGRVPGGRDDYDATPAFYRRLGAEVEDRLPGEIRHAHIHYDGVDVHIDNEHLG
jgi:hypothetical protein